MSGDNVAKVLTEVDEMLNQFVDSLRFVTQLDESGANDISAPAVDAEHFDTDGDNVANVKVSDLGSLPDVGGAQGNTDEGQAMIAQGAERGSGVYGLDPVSGDVLKISAPDGMYRSGQFMNTVEGLAGVALNKGQIESRLEKKVAQSFGQ